jgi:hypothetical protein
MTFLLCRACKQDLPEKNFGPRWKKMVNGRLDGYKPICSKCENEKNKQSRHSSYIHYLKYLRGKTNSRKTPVHRDFTANFLLELFHQQNGLCAVSKLPMTWTYDEGHAQSGSRRGTNISIDRINSDGPYSKDNVRLVCDRVNKIKSNMNDDDLYFWCAQIASSMRS